MIKRSLITVAVLATCTVASAHHSYSAFDLKRQLILQGRVKALEWTNPHVWVWILRENGKEEPVSFGFETVAPGELTRNYGWTKSSIKVGDQVTVMYAPLRDGQNGGSLMRVTMSDGRVLNTPGIHFLPPAEATSGGAQK